MKRLALILLCVAIGVLFLARGDEPAPPPEGGEDAAPARVPLPPLPPGPPPAVQARGLYVFDGETLRLALTLEAGGRFRLVSRRPPTETRVGEGTWTLERGRLTLTYLRVNGEVPPGDPPTAVNRWSGSTIEMQETGLARPVVLTKRTMLRSR